jgi:hypothetical protein
MLQQTRSGNGAFFGDMANNENGDVLRLCQRHQLCRALAYLADAAWRRWDFGSDDRLNRIDNNYTRSQFEHMVANEFDSSVRTDVDVLALQPQPIATHAQLAGRFFARDIEHSCRWGNGQLADASRGL